MRKPASNLGAGYFPYIENHTERSLTMAQEKKVEAAENIAAEAE